MLRQAQFFRQQIERRAVHMQLLVGAVQVLLHLLQRLHVAGAGNVGAFGGGLPASHGQKLPAQRIQAITRLG